MKQIVLFIIIISLLSCGNDKSVIVEQIKSCKDSLTIIEKRRADLNLEISAVQEKYVGQQALDSVAAVKEKQSAERAELEVKKINFNSKINSLELELKKY